MVGKSNRETLLGGMKRVVDYELRTLVIKGNLNLKSGETTVSSIPLFFVS